VKVAVLGLGLIGGSVARDLAAAGHTVLGFDRSAATLRAARRARVIEGTIGPDFDGLESCDVCVIAVPVTDAPRLLARAARALATVPLITDVGSTKRSIVRAAEAMGLGRRFIGAHPFAGDHRSGWRASRRGLFRDAPLFLTPARSTPPATLARARRFWRVLGARPRLLSPAKHDQLMAGASHVPQLVSSMLALTLAGAGIPRSALGPGGRDVTRLAGADRVVWTAILLDNADRIVPMLRAHERTLRRVRSALAGGRAMDLSLLLRAANGWHRAR
jgi:prephenate dehydrogenase